MIYKLRAAIFRLLFIWLFLLQACHFAEKKKDILVKYNYYPLTIISADSIIALKNITNLLDSIEVIPLQTVNNNIIGTVDKVIYFEHKYFLLDRTYSSLMEFDQNGKYIGIFGSLGNSKNQYTELGDFLIDSIRRKVILLSNSTTISTLIFDLDDRRFIQSKGNGLFARNFGYINNCCYYYINNNVSPFSGRFNLVCVDSVSGEIGRVFPLYKGYQPGYIFSGFLSSNEDGLLYSGPLSDTIFQITNKIIYPRYAIKFNSLKMPDSIRKNFILFQRFALFYSTLQNSFIDTKDYLSFSFTKKGVLVVCFYDKKCKKTYSISMIDNNPLSYLLRSPVGEIGNDRYITSVKASELSDLFASRQSDKDTIKKYCPALYSVMSSIKSTDNPVLVTFILKKSIQ